MAITTLKESIQIMNSAPFGIATQPAGDNIAGNRQSAIREKMSVQKQVLGELKQCITELSKRLEGVCDHRPSPPSEEKQPPPDCTSVPLADELGKHNSEINMCCRLLEELTRRIEV